MPRRLRVTTGCLRCRERRKKCDEVKPTCGSCTRLGIACRWKGDPDSSASLVRAMVSQQGNRSLFGGYDDPAVLQGSATSVIRSSEDKQTFLYLCERGSMILRYPTQLLPTQSTVNPFTLGFQMARHFPVQVKAYLALGAAHRSRTQGHSRVDGLMHYAGVVAALRTEFDDATLICPTEPMCAVAAILCMYEVGICSDCSNRMRDANRRQLVSFTSTEHRLVHLNGYYKLVEARLSNDASWGPFQVLVDHYIHSFTINLLSHYQYHVGDKGIHYISDLINRFKHGRPGLGKEVVGVPADLTIAAYKLTFLLHQDTTQAPWNVELNAVSKMVCQWYPASYTLTTNATGLLVVGKLYQFACMCLQLYVQDKAVSETDARIIQIVTNSVQIIESSMLHDYPFNCLSWPLIVLGLFADGDEHRQSLRQPLRNLETVAKMGGYATAVNFLDSAWTSGMGPKALSDETLLATLSI